MKPYYLISLFAVLPMMAQTQLFTFGLKGGVPTQTPLQAESQTPFVLGPTLTVRILPRLSLETGVLFDRIGQESNNLVFLYPENAVTQTYNTERGRAIEVPLLAKYRFLSGRRAWQPFVTAGPTVRRTSIDESHLSSILSGTSISSGASFINVAVQSSLNRTTVKWNVDPAVGAGIDFKTGRFHLEPELRYSRWGAGKNTAVRRNQVNALLGFRF